MCSQKKSCLNAVKGAEVDGLEQLHFLGPPEEEDEADIEEAVMMADLGLVGEFGLDVAVVDRDLGLIGGPPPALPLDDLPAEAAAAEDMLEQDDDIDMRLPTFWS